MQVNSFILQLSSALSCRNTNAVEERRLYARRSNVVNVLRARGIT